MFEHVGQGNLDAYFCKIAALLKPGGLVLNHGITTSAPEAGGLGSGISEFIDKYVFPGSELVHVSDVLRAAAGSGQRPAAWNAWMPKTCARTMARPCGTGSPVCSSMPTKPAS